MNWVRTLRVALVVVLAAVALAAGATFGYAPDVLPTDVLEPLLEFTAEMDPPVLAVLVGGLTGVLGLLAVWAWQMRGHPREFYDPTILEANRNVPAAGRAFKSEVANTEFDVPTTKRALQDVLGHALREQYGDREAVERAIRTGAWTDDRLAAAFLSGSERTDYPFLHRVYAWLYPEQATAKRLERSVREVEREASRGFVRYDMPQRELGRLERGRDRLARLWPGDQI